jgi:transcriptional repressor NrdR
VSDSRSLGDGVRRRRRCTQCKRRFTTYERAAPPNVKVVKRSGKSEPFDAAKIRAVLARVGSGRPALDGAAIKRLAAGIEAELVDAGVRSISSATIAERLLAQLKNVDKLAHDRLAADYLDESGQLRVEGPSTADVDQLGLFEEEP